MSLTQVWMSGWDHPGAVAIATEEEELTFDALRSRVQRAAGWLLARGIGAGDVVALQLDKVPAFLEIHLAALALGAITLPMNPAYPPAEVRWMLEDAGAALALVPDSGGADVVRVPPESLRAALDAAEPAELPDDVDLECVGLLCYTSGTTGRPKGAQIRQRNLRACVDALHEAWGWRATDRLVHALPLFHVHGLFVAQHGALRAGATSLWHRRFDAVRVLDALERDAATVFMGVPTFYHRMLQADPGSRDLSRVRLFTSGSAGLPARDWHAWKRATGHGIVERYGMTEVCIVVSNPLDDPRPGSIGVPLPGVRARVLDPEERTVVPPGVVGELEIAGPSVFAGYLGRPRATAEALVGGWMRTGDLATVDPEGRLTLVGRQSQMILRGGLNVYPAEVEAIAREHPGVGEIAVFGVPDPDLGERVHAAIVWRPGVEPDPAGLQRALEARLARYKLPEALHALEALPRNAMGKVMRAPLIERFRPL